MPAVRAASSRLMPSKALANASRRARTRPSRSRRAKARSSTGARSVLIDTATMARSQLATPPRPLGAPQPPVNISSDWYQSPRTGRKVIAARASPDPAGMPTLMGSHLALAEVLDPDPVDQLEL